MDPPAMISAPDATEPSTVTSPSGKTTDCPERTGLSISKDAAFFGIGAGLADGGAGLAGGLGCGSGLTAVSAQCALRSLGGSFVVVSLTSTPSSPSTRMPSP